MSERQAILNLHNQWLALELSGRAEGVLDLCSDDVCWFVPGVGTIVGKQQIHSFLRQQESETLQDIDISEIEIEISGSLAVKKAGFRTRILGDDQESTVEITGTHIWTLRRPARSDRWVVTNVAWVVRECV